MKYISSLRGFRAFVFMGEAGSGKTELSVNLGIHMAAHIQKPVHFFDMDQTKPLFRARNNESLLTSAGIKMHYVNSLLDVPVITPGVGEKLRDRSKICILDVGGTLAGAKMVGQLADYLNTPDVAVFYVINCFRQSCAEAESIRSNMELIIQGAGVSKVRIISNPNLGAETTREDVLQGLMLTNQVLEDLNLAWDLAAVHKKLLPTGPPLMCSNTIPINLYFTH